MESQVRVLPVPRLEPPTDEERRSAGLDAPPMTAPVLPLDLPPGPPLRRRSGQRTGPDGGPAGPLREGESVVIATGTGGNGGHPAEPQPTNDVAWERNQVGERCGARRGGTRGRLPAGPGGDTGHPAGGLGDRLAPMVAVLERARHITDDHVAGTAEDTRSGASLPVRAATVRFLATCLEVAGGFRPVAQLRPSCRPDRFEHIAEQVRLWGQAPPPGGPRRAGQRTTRTPISYRSQSGAPPRTGRAAQRGPGDRVAVRRVHICDVSSHVAEVAVVLSYRETTWAAVLRMEHRNGRWVCAFLSVV
jgi:hypothetical protein